MESPGPAFDPVHRQPCRQPRTRNVATTNDTATTLRFLVVRFEYITSIVSPLGGQTTPTNNRPLPTYRPLPPQLRRGVPGLADQHPVPPPARRRDRAPGAGPFKTCASETRVCCLELRHDDLDVARNLLVVARYPTERHRGVAALATLGVPSRHKRGARSGAHAFKALCTQSLALLSKREASPFPAAPLVPTVSGLRLRTLAVCFRPRSSKRTYSVQY